MRIWLFCVPLFVQCVGLKADVIVQDLGGNEWSAAGNHPPSTVVNFIPYATVPGCVHTDWYNTTQKLKENDPYYRFNDLNLKWIPECNWDYKRTFQVDKSLLSRKEQYLVCEGLDTIATVTLNGKVLGVVQNMFVKHVFNVTGTLQQKFNQISISFESALKVANATNKTMPYLIPPECPPDVQHGYCHVNLIRKEQSSFSWDWGPAFATQGIWKPIYLVGLDDVVMNDAVITYDWDAEMLLLDLRFRTTNDSKVHNGVLIIYISELNIAKSFNVSVNSSASLSSINVHFSIPSNSLTYWWPNGQGDQKLYNITLLFQSQMGSDVSNKTIWFGFRKVELVQERINGSDGLSFYFKINDRPIFAKGSNWIPADAFQNRLTHTNYTNLLQSAKDANMNMLRVWGGGVYEQDEFYKIADQLGIMIWHDFMFACAMYPANSEFLTSVNEEINDTIWRLKSHPSIVIWAGNNENEAALGTDWYNISSHFDRYKADYVSLYIDTIGKTVSAMDKSRPFVSSSPSNGVESKTEGWVSKKPYDTHYGDVHYYNYDADCLDWTKYPKSRFSSEYGFQSWPSLETLQSVSVKDDLIWDSPFGQHRQHHANGNQQMKNQIMMHFKLPDSKDMYEEFEDMVYLSQIMQALCYRSESEFYRRSRSELVNGEGHTMGALYWQLNDIWQAPTWSSIEYGGKWKAVHYHAKQFFNTVALTAFDDDTTMTVYTLSDQNAPIEPVTLIIEMRQWKSFGVLNTWTSSIYITPQSSKMQYQNSTGTMLHYGGCEYKELCYFTIRLKELEDVPPAYFYPVGFKDIDGLQKAEITIEDVQHVQKRSIASSVVEESNVFNISLSTTATAAFVWLEATGIKGRFSDNAFMFYESSKTISFFAWEDVTPGILKNSLKVRSLSDLYSASENPDHLLKEPNEAPESLTFLEEDLKLDVDKMMQEIYWLDDIGAQLAFAIFGVLFILFFAILLACVVMRFNSPGLDKPTVIASPHTLNSRRTSRMLSPLLEDNESYHSSEEGDRDEGGAFMIKMKHGYGHNAKNVEIRFYVT